MARPLLVRDEAKDRLRRAVQAVEARSSAEVVVSVQVWSASWAAVDIAVGAGLAYLALLYMLFAPHVFGLVWIALISAACFAVGFVGMRAIPKLRMRLAGPARVRAAVLQAARARFVELGVTATRERSGLLVYVSLTERLAAVVPDAGVLARVPKKDWEPAVRRIEDAIESHGIEQAGLDALAKAIEALGDVVEKPMPRAADDINELEDVA